MLECSPVPGCWCVAFGRRAWEDAGWVCFMCTYVRVSAVHLYFCTQMPVRVQVCMRASTCVHNYAMLQYKCAHCWQCIACSFYTVNAIACYTSVLGSCVLSGEGPLEVAVVYELTGVQVGHAHRRSIC